MQSLVCYGEWRRKDDTLNASGWENFFSAEAGVKMLSPALQHDVSVTASSNAIVEAVQQQFGQIDILVKQEE